MPAKGPHFPWWIIEAARKHGVDYGRVCVTAESRHLVLMPYQIGQVAAIYASELKTPPTVVLDATANIGCDTIQFCKMFPDAAVTSVEINVEVCEILKLNMTHLANILGRKVVRPVTVLNGDCVQLLAGGLRADLVYFDVPWGGPEYYKAPSIRLMLSGRPLGDVVGEALAGNTPLVVVKVPNNADMKEFMETVSSHAEHGTDFRTHNIVKPKGAVAYRLVFVRRRPAGN